MLFENINQYDKAKKVLLENERDVNLVLGILKKDKDFSNLSEGELKSSLIELNEGLGEKITNFLSSAFGGDISKIKTTLTQMKEQELKFNQEEYEVYKEFYRLLQDQKQLDKDRNNPDYNSLSKEIEDAMNALNTRLRELSKAHDEIFNALEEKVKSLAADNKRKTKYFNAQRATDVLETRKDRYEKIKALTSDSVKRSKELEKFFGINVDDTKEEMEKAAAEAQKKVDNLTPPSTGSSQVSFDESPEKELHQKLEKIENGPGGFYAKRKDLEDLQDDLLVALQDDAFQTYSDKKQKSIHSLYLAAVKLYRQLELDATKVK